MNSAFDRAKPNFSPAFLAGCKELQTKPGRTPWKYREVSPKQREALQKIGLSDGDIAGLDRGGAWLCLLQHYNVDQHNMDMNYLYGGGSWKNLERHCD